MPMIPPAQPSPPAARRAGELHRRSLWQDEVLAPMLARHAGKRVLVADHHPTDRQRLFELLAEARFRLDFAIDGADAVTRASDHPVDLILMNTRMPVMDGLTASRILRGLSFGRQVPIIALSDDVLDDACVRCFAAGIDDIIAKPFVADALQRCLLRWLDRRPAAQDAAGPRRGALAAV